MTPNDIVKLFARDLPIDVYHIARTLGAEVQETPVIFNDPNVHGAMKYNEEQKPVIFVKSTDHINRKRFTVAHELGHHLLNHGNQFDTEEVLFRRGNAAYNPVEAEANRFAASLLMPDFVVKYLIRKDKILSISNLAKVLGVSEMAMMYRLKNLGFLNGL